MKPYRAMHTPPITQSGIVARNVTKGAINEATTAKMAVMKMVITEALPEIATQPTDSPYVVLGQPPKSAPTIEPTPSPRSVLERPGSFKRSVSMIEDIFLWSARCSANTTNATGM